MLAAAASSLSFPGFRLFGVSLGNRRLAQLIGGDKAFDTIFRGAALPASRALDMGLLTHVLEAQAQQVLTARGWQPDYLTVRRQADLLPAGDSDDRRGHWVALGAARLGATRLIDNLEFTV